MILKTCYSTSSARSFVTRKRRRTGSHATKSARPKCWCRTMSRHCGRSRSDPQPLNRDGTNRSQEHGDPFRMASLIWTPASWWRTRLTSSITHGSTLTGRPMRSGPGHGPKRSLTKRWTRPIRSGRCRRFTDTCCPVRRGFRRGSCSLARNERTGKGTNIKLLKALEGNLVYSIRSSLLANQFVMEGAVGKRLMVVPDVRLSKDSDFSAIGELILTVTGEDDVDVQRKNKPVWTGKTTVRLILMSNSIPLLRDPDGVLASRFIYLTFPNSFYGREDPELFDALLAERSAILRWAVEGW
ncbi:DUF5906 domain-containing protein [Ruegeria sp. HKCCD6228]|uniref:DUF5906 domain-containing protein n=1 Tax=Ruegeria sp. HKCCD6228 TaxID=2683001 RepID=UPI00353032D9